MEVPYIGIPWKLENEDLSDDCYSNCFSLGKQDNAFYFELHPRDEGSMCLSLWQIRGDPLKTLDLLIVINYKNKRKYSLYQNTRKSRKRETLRGLYDLTIIKTRDLVEIICFLLKIEFSETGEETENEVQEDSEEECSEEEYSNDKQDEEEIKEEQEWCLLNINREEESNKSGDGENAKENEPTKSRGETALIENLRNAFLNEEDSDVILKVGDQKYPAHRVIIRARSPVFEAMLKHDMVEKNEGVVDIADCDPHVFRSFLYYLYTGKLEDITNENVFELYHVSDKYDVIELRKDCLDCIASNLTIDSLCDALSLAIRHCEQDLLSLATMFFIDNVTDILTTVNWQKFVNENPEVANELFIKTVTKNYPK